MRRVKATVTRRGEGVAVRNQSEKTRGVLILTADDKSKINIPTLYANRTSIT
ncbi:MAG: hypothetical protein QXQ41_02775 [Candidatus Bathyarchaeia archaeon]